MNPIADITDPAILRARVQDGVECLRCAGTGDIYEGFTPEDIGAITCPYCIDGHTPLRNADLDALAAKWCEGWKYFPTSCPGSICTWRNFDNDNFPGWHYSPPAYTTSPDAAMRLMVKYELDVEWVGLEVDPGIGDVSAFGMSAHRKTIYVRFEGGTVEALCHAITTTALIAALTEAMEGASDADD